LFEKADIVIANDTGPMHLAVSMKARTIALFGPTSSRITGPCGTGDYVVISKNDICDAPCYNVTCEDNRCMAMISPDEVVKEASAMLTCALRAGRANQ
jgi:heptosyltransferase-1